MAKTLFKGIKQVKYSTYTATDAPNKAGYLWFVRPDNAADGTIGDIYFGSRHYGKVDEAGYAKIEDALAGFLGNDSKTVKAYVDDIISGLTVATTSEAGKPIVSISQTNGKISAAVGTINAENVNIADSGSVITATTVEGALQEIATEIDNMDLAQVGGTNKIITTISEADGRVSATAIDATAANILVADSGEKFVATNVEDALSELADKAKSQEISSSDNTIVVTSTSGGTNIATNIDGITIVKDGTSGILSTTLQLSGITPSTAETNVREEYVLVDASGNTHGAAVKIYKDSSLYSAYMGHVDDALTSESDPTVIPGTGDTALCFIYYKVDGTYELVAINVESFLQESEFSDGLQVNNHVVSVKIDSTSESFLTVSSNGVKLSGVQNAITSAIHALDVTGDTAVSGQYVSAIEETDGIVAVKSRANVSDAHLNGYTKGSDGTAVASGDSINAAISKLENQVDNAKASATTVVENASGNVHVTVSASTAADGHNIYTVNESDIASASGLSDEIAARKAVDGQTGSTYAANTGATYISGATSLNNADVLLDTAVKNLADNAYTGVTAGNGISATTTANNGQVVSVKKEASTTTTVSYGHIELAFNDSGEIYGIMYYDGDDSEPIPAS